MSVTETHFGVPRKRTLRAPSGRSRVRHFRSGHSRCDRCRREANIAHIVTNNPMVIVCLQEKFTLTKARATTARPLSPVRCEHVWTDSDPPQSLPLRPYRSLVMPCLPSRRTAWTWLQNRCRECRAGRHSRLPPRCCRQSRQRAETRPDRIRCRPDASRRRC